MAILNFPTPTTLSNIQSPSANTDAATKQYVDSAVGGSTADQFARDTANTAAANTVYQSGVNTTQNTSINSAIANTIYTQGVDAEQNTNISIVQGGLNTANANISVLFGIETTQNTGITSATTLAQAAFDKANTGITSSTDQTARDTANSASSNTTYQSGVNATQNTNISIVQGGLNTANANITYILGVDTTQNTNITSATTLAQAAFNQANSASSGTIDSYARTTANNASSNTIYTQGVDAEQNTNIQTLSDRANTVYNTSGSFSVGGSAQFNGTNNYLSASAPALPTGSSSFTIEAWVYNATGSRGEIVNWGNQNNNQLNAFRLDGTGLTHYHWYNDLSTGNIGLAANTWYHVVAQYDGTTRKIFVNGVLKASDTPSTPNVTGTALNIGQINSSYYSGYISNLRISNVARYSGSSYTVPTSPLTATANTVLLTCQSTSTITDASTNSYTITNNGSVIPSAQTPFIASGATGILVSAYDAANTASANTIYTQGVDVTQNTNISIVQGGLNTANANITLLFAIDTAQNTNITSATTLAQAAFDKANTGVTSSTDQTARDTANSAQANTIYTQGVDVTQNNSIVSLNTYAIAAFTQANLAYTVAQQANTTANLALPKTGGTITGSLVVSDNLSVVGNLIVLGTSTTINTNSFVVQDSLMVLGANNYTSDILDIGFVGHYNDGTNAHSGLIRDSDTKEYYLFKGYTPEVDANNNVDISHASFSKANINASYFKGNLIATTATVNGIELGSYTQAAFSAANTASANTVYQSGVNVTQNNSITYLTTFAQAAYNQANNTTNPVDQFARDTANTASSNTVQLSIVNASQNLTIISIGTTANSAYAGSNSATILAQAAFNAANSAGSSSGVDSIARDTANGAFTAANSALASVGAGAPVGTLNGANTFSNTINYTTTIPVVLNDISTQFDGVKVVFPMQLDQNNVVSIVDSKNVELVVNGARLAPYIKEIRYPWFTPYDSYKGFRVVSDTSQSQLVIYNAPSPGDQAILTIINTSSVQQTRKYPFSAATISLGD